MNDNMSESPVWDGTEEGAARIINWFGGRGVVAEYIPARPETCGPVGRPGSPVAIYAKYGAGIWVSRGEAVSVPSLRALVV